MVKCESPKFEMEVRFFQLATYTFFTRNEGKMEFNEDWKNLYFEQKDLTKVYREWCDELKKENLMLREKLNKPPIEPPSKINKNLRKCE